MHSVCLCNFERVRVWAQLAVMRVRYLEGGEKTALIIYYFKQPCSAQMKEASYMNREIKKMKWQLEYLSAQWNDMITFPLMQISPLSCCTACHWSYGAEFNGCFAPLRFISFPWFVWSSGATIRVNKLKRFPLLKTISPCVFWERVRLLRKP